MTTALSRREKKLTARKEFISQIEQLEEQIANRPDAERGDDIGELKHSFGDGLYIRQITMPKGHIITSKIHKTRHPYFVLRGDVSVRTEDGPVHIKAPYFGITEPGTKRALFCHEETVWITVHATKETDLKKIEEEVIIESYELLEDDPTEIKLMR